MITYLAGDATQPILVAGQVSSRWILHVCNNQGGWGSGFVVALSSQWPGPEREYRLWHKQGFLADAGKFELGNIQLVSVKRDLHVVNMIAQEGYGPGNRAKHRGDLTDSKPPIRYDALDQCLAKAAEVVGYGSVHMPRIGCGLAGGKWSEVEPLIQRHFSDRHVCVYDLPGQPYVEP